MPTIQLSDRSLIKVAGPDAEHFLQNIVTTDLDQLPPGTIKPGALLTPQGKILFDFLISREDANSFVLECRADIADDFSRRLLLYRLRARAEITKQEQKLISVSWEEESDLSQTDSTKHGPEWLADSRFPREAGVTRSYSSSIEPYSDESDWERLRITNGVAESGRDYSLGDAFPHDVLLDETGGVGFKKGCYVGQEVVSRMQHRGTARRRVMLVQADVELPASGTEIKANNRAIGTLGSVVGGSGIAIVRIDRVKAAQDAGYPIMAGEVELSLSIPGWARYTLPADASAAGDA